jgi:hypothetical protein
VASGQGTVKDDDGGTAPLHLSSEGRGVGSGKNREAGTLEGGHAVLPPVMIRIGDHDHARGRGRLKRQFNHNAPPH